MICTWCNFILNQCEKNTVLNRIDNFLLPVGCLIGLLNCRCWWWWCCCCFHICCCCCRSCCCSRSVTDWSVKLSIRSISHWRCGSFLMARYSWMKACGFSDMWSSANSSLHWCCGSSLNLSSALMSAGPMTASWNKKLMTLAGLTLSMTVECSFLNLSFNTSFDSIDN